MAYWLAGSAKRGARNPFARHQTERHPLPGPDPGSAGFAGALGVAATGHLGGSRGRELFFLPTICPLKLDFLESWQEVAKNSKLTEEDLQAKRLCLCMRFACFCMHFAFVFPAFCMRFAYV